MTVVQAAEGALAMSSLRLFEVGNRAVTLVTYGDTDPARAWVWTARAGTKVWIEAPALAHVALDGRWLSAVEFAAEFPGVPVPSLPGATSHVRWRQ